jgi:hypothetical protein
MSNQERHAGNGKKPFLRVFYGEEADTPKDEAQLDSNQPSHELNEEVEAVWSGRTPAARISTRVAA